MLFYSFFKTLVGKEIVVELKNGAAAASLAAAHRSVVPARPPTSRAADLAIRGTLHSVDQFLNIKLLTVSVEDSENFPHMVCRCAGPRLSLGRAQSQPQLQPRPHPQPLALSPSAASRCPSPSLSPARLNPHRTPLVESQQSVKNCFIRGSVIRYVQLPSAEIDTELLQDATRRESAQQKNSR